MPEGDTVYNLAARLAPVLVGKPLLRCDLRVPRYASTDLTGSVVTAVVARGKHLLISVGAWTLHSHLKMDGEWLVYRTGERWRRPGHTARAVLEVAGHQVVGFALGHLEVVAADAVDRLLTHLGPDPLSDNWDPDQVAANLAADPARPIGLALLDQRVLAGVGNVYRSEVCFVLRTHPGVEVRHCGDLTEWAERSADLLRANRGRTTRVTTGVDRPGRRTFVYDRARRPCLRCATPIEAGPLGVERFASSADSARTIWWCPTCQGAVGHDR